MKANTCLLLLVIAYFVLGLPIALVVLVNSIIKLTTQKEDVFKYGVCAAISVLVIAIMCSYYI